MRGEAEPAAAPGPARRTTVRPGPARPDIVRRSPARLGLVGPGPARRNRRRRNRPRRNPGGADPGGRRAARRPGPAPPARPAAPPGEGKLLPWPKLPTLNGFVRLMRLVPDGPDRDGDDGTAGWTPELYGKSEVVPVPGMLWTRQTLRKFRAVYDIEPDDYPFRNGFYRPEDDPPGRRIAPPPPDSRGQRAWRFCGRITLLERACTCPYRGCRRDRVCFYPFGTRCPVRHEEFVVPWTPARKSRRPRKQPGRADAGYRPADPPPGEAAASPPTERG